MTKKIFTGSIGILMLAFVGRVIAADDPKTTTTEKALKGQVLIDGSSTVYPISSAAAEEFGKLPTSKNIRVKVATSGTGGGLQKFCRGEVDISGASRPIEKKEIDLCASAGIKFV